MDLTLSLISSDVEDLSAKRLAGAAQRNNEQGVIQSIGFENAIKLWSNCCCPSKKISNQQTSQLHLPESGFHGYDATNRSLQRHSANQTRQLCSKVGYLPLPPSRVLNPGNCLSRITTSRITTSRSPPPDHHLQITTSRSPPPDHHLQRLSSTHTHCTVPMTVLLSSCH